MKGESLLLKMHESDDGCFHLSVKIYLVKLFCLTVIRNIATYSSSETNRLCSSSLFSSKTAHNYKKTCFSIHSSSQRTLRLASKMPWTKIWPDRIEVLHGSLYMHIIRFFTRNKARNAINLHFLGVIISNIHSIKQQKRGKPKVHTFIPLHD